MPVKKKKAIKRKVARKKAIKKPIKRRAKKAPARKKAAPAKKEKGKVIGVVTHYFPKVRAAVIKVKTALNSGDVIKIKGHTTDFTQTVASMQLDHVTLASAKKGQEIGLLVDSRVRQHDVVYKV